MLDKLGVVGVAGIVVMAGGLGVLAYANPLVAAGVALVLIGIGLLVRGLVASLLQAFGMGGMP